MPTDRGVEAVLWYLSPLTPTNSCAQLSQRVQSADVTQDGKTSTVTFKFNNVVSTHLLLKKKNKYEKTDQGSFYGMATSDKDSGLLCCCRFHLSHKGTIHLSMNGVQCARTCWPATRGYAQFSQRKIHF